MAAPVNSSFALDPNALAALKAKASSAPDQKSLKQAATQFEAVFMNMMLKSMRDTLSQDGPMESQTTKTYTGMLDQQLSQTLAGQGGPNGSGIGLADMIVKQLTRQMKAGSGAAGALPGVAPEGMPLTKPGMSLKKAELQQIQSSVKIATSTDTSGQAQNFINRLLPDAQAAQDATGVPARFLLAQAALESGWGKSSIKATDGTDSHNIFGIKAGRDWKGPVAEASTTEYVNGVAQKVKQHFRAYSSYADSFADYAKLIAGNSRYKNVLAHGGSATGFASALQRAGYATDPQYAQKIARIIQNSNLKGVA